MMFHRVTKDAFYIAVKKLRTAARNNGQTFERRESPPESDDLRIEYHINGVPNAQAVMHHVEADPRFYILK